MTNDLFIQTICNYYKRSRQLSVDAAKHNIWRGVNHSVSSQAEDLFAYLIAERLNDNSLEFIVDKTMSYRLPNQPSKQFRPDLAIVRNGVLTHSIDLKMDMGYKRRYFETDSFKIEEQKFKAFRNNACKTVTYNINGVTQHLLVSKKIMNQIVVVSEKNEGKASNREDMMAAIQALDWARIYYLSGGVHPNTYSDKTPTVNHKAFEQLIADIRKFA